MDELANRYSGHHRAVPLIQEVFPAGYDEEYEARGRHAASKMGYSNLLDPDKGTVEYVDIDIIHPCQKVLMRDTVIGLLIYMLKNEVPGYPAGLMMDGEVYLIDGHHRVAAQILTGKKKVAVHIRKVENIDK